jgi:hypothetical protein
MTCDAPNPGTEMRCQREQGHSGECSSKYRAEYEHGIVSYGTMWWCGPNNLPKEQQNEPE